MLLKDMIEHDVLGAFIISSSRRYIGLITDVFESRHAGDCIIEWNDSCSNMKHESSWWYWSLHLSLVCPPCYENEINIDLLYDKRGY